MNHSCIKEFLKKSNLTVITRENVNTILIKYDLTLIELCVRQSCCFEDGVVAWLLSMGAEITEETLLHCCDHFKYLAYLLGHVVNQRKMTTLIERTLVRWAFVYRICILIDYGVPCPYRFTRTEENSFGVQKIRAYEHLSNTRVATSRRSLCALLWCSRRGFIPPSPPFRGLSGIILQLARAAWAHRGGEGCGARAHGWLLQLE